MTSPKKRNKGISRLIRHRFLSAASPLLNSGEQRRTLTKWLATQKGPARARLDHTKTSVQQIGGCLNPPHCSGTQDNVRRMAVRVQENRRRRDWRGVPGADRRGDRWSRDRWERREPGRNSNLSSHYCQNVCIFFFPHPKLNNLFVTDER